MIFRFRRSGDRAEHVFYGGRHPDHAVGLQLGEVDDQVLVQQPGGAGENMGGGRLREGQVPGAGIQVQPGARCRRQVHARFRVAPLQG